MKPGLARAELMFGSCIQSIVVLFGREVAEDATSARDRHTIFSFVESNF